MPVALCFIGRPWEDRTPDQRIKSPKVLSYLQINKV